MALAVIVALWICWAIAYKLILGFTPIWLDLATYGGAGVAMLLAWVVGRSGKVDYSRKVEDEQGRSEREL
ncbi:hypothetical protein [Paucibacter sp. DJ2R-2]|uniref:hypothetical protein n=1 Tax=Paucibacter sp. DJ2R-2 TaxID=2893558 RepID=UPI0021E43950|nr:hypothetical protein [Paucibacter sp. DJ2R-2]MCV2422272.1 hypothetical protein [Paucibacter sp. DJ4R-1]MCV2440144.1 hypothetical protein [Paucibacter sp. DJ2R-2]